LVLRTFGRIHQPAQCLYSVIVLPRGDIWLVGTKASCGEVP
jgi:hypothetical protein